MPTNGLEMPPDSDGTVANVDRIPCRAMVLQSSVLDELVLYSPEQGMGVSLNRSAAAIWELCDGLRSTYEICRELADVTKRPVDELLPDVQAAVLKLCDLKVLTWNE